MDGTRSFFNFFGRIIGGLLAALTIKALVTF